MTLHTLAQQLKHLPGKHSQASHASGKASMPSRFSEQFRMNQKAYDEVAGSLGNEWGQNTLNAYEFKSGGLRSEVVRVRHMRKPGLVHVQGTIHDAAGKQVG